MRELALPEISRFYGLSIRMYVERGERHHLPHFHVLYQGKGAAYRIDTAEVIGRIPSSTSAKVGGGVGGVAPR
ncbi:DUF4160 domain-containing protein [Caldilinea sp.]|uniref:DUF4160 domain-containing protein n=1 Tax=Caldilinea sp. TaxID=2293560 RepID=UPI0031CC59EC